MSNGTINPTQAGHLVRTEEMLAEAQRSPVLSGAQACNVAQVYALLAIEQRLAQLCASVDAAVTAIVDLSRPDDAAVAVVPLVAS